MKKWIFPILSSITAAIISIVYYDRLPERMAVHFDASESPDNWVNKSVGGFLIPALILFVTMLVLLSAKFEKDENKRRRTEATIGSIMAIVSATLLTVHLFIITYNLGYELSISMSVTLLVGVIYILLGNLIPRLPQGSMKWPKLTETAHRKASRFQGRFMMIIGIVMLFASFLPTSYILYAFFFLISSFIIGLISSSIHYSRTQ